jgi:GTPase
VTAHRERMEKTGEHAALRREQQVKWMWSMLNERVFAQLKSDSHVRARLPAIEAAVAEGRLSATLAVEEIARMLRI